MLEIHFCTTITRLHCSNRVFIEIDIQSCDYYIYTNRNTLDLSIDVANKHVEIAYHSYQVGYHL